MIQYLHIRDLALLDQVTLDFESGFSAITGETGAGKSVLLGALAMLSGNRLDKSIIRHACESCKVEAAIHLKNPTALNQKLEQLELPPCEDQTLLISRTLHQTRVPKILVNGAVTTLGNLASIGEYWIDFHGPGEPQKLFKERFQLGILDLYAGLETELDQYQNHYRQWQLLKQEHAELSDATQLSDDETHYLQEQIRRIDELGMDEASLTELEQQFRKLNGAEELNRLFQEIASLLENENGVIQLLSRILQCTRPIEQIDPSTSPLWRRMDSLGIELEDLRQEVHELADSVDFDESQAALLKTRMESWMDLKRKHGKEASAILKARESMAQRLRTHRDIHSTLADLESRILSTQTALLQIGKAITLRRTEAAKTLSREVATQLQSLGFKKAGFDIAIIEESAPKEHGTSRCQILFSPNPGNPMQALNKIASSGETARVMLAIKTVVASFDETPVLVFDEVDANVGGEIGKAVGTAMANLSHKHQIFCVTHLPQVAALANQHLVVTKLQMEDQTTVSIQPLEAQSYSRVVELARMLGDRQSDTALRHAKELLGIEADRLL
jgi:DNA repair protein RecN (Recombination protein N)